MSCNVLVTGFSAFSATSDNPSQHLAAASGVDNITLEVAFEAVDAWLESGAAKPYDVILHLGFADRHHITPELFARNFIGHTPDVRGIVRGGDIEPGAPLLLNSTLWTPALLSDILLDDRLRTSEDAGSYLCNYISYKTLQAFPDKAIGFMHVPPLERIGFDDQLAVLSAVLKRLTA